jgi:hypothetical protein
MIVVESPLNSEPRRTALDQDACHPSNALNPQLFATCIRRAKENLDLNFRSDCWALVAVNERPIEGNIARKATRCVFDPIIPMENHGQVQLVSHRLSTLWLELHVW